MGNTEPGAESDIYDCLFGAHASFLHYLSDIPDDYPEGFDPKDIGLIPDEAEELAHSRSSRRQCVWSNMSSPRDEQLRSQVGISDSDQRLQVIMSLSRSLKKIQLSAKLALIKRRDDEFRTKTIDKMGGKWYVHSTFDS